MQTPSWGSRPAESRQEPKTEATGRGSRLRKKVSDVSGMTAATASSMSGDVRSRATWTLSEGPETSAEASEVSVGVGSWRVGSKSGSE